MTLLIGFLHEQTRPDRDEYIDILWDNIHEGGQAQFSKLRVEDWFKSDEPYDFNSAMHYSSYNGYAIDPEKPTMVYKGTSKPVLPTSPELACLFIFIFDDFYSILKDKIIDTLL